MPVIDTRLLLRRVDVLEAKSRRYERELETMPPECADAKRIMQGICADLYAEQRRTLQYANELAGAEQFTAPARDYLEGFA